MNIIPPIEFEETEAYKTLFDNAHDLIHFAKPDGSLVYVNRSWMNTLGYSLEEIKGKPIRHFVSEEDKERFVTYRRGVIEGSNTDPKIVVSLRSKSGDLVKVEGFILLKTDNNLPLYTTGIFRDVTKNLQNETQLKESHALLQQSEHDLQQLLINAPDSIVVIDQYGSIQFWNPKAESMFGWMAQEVLGESLTYTIVPPQHRAAHDAGMKRYLATGEVHVLNKTIEITALKKNGEEFFVSLTISTTHQKGKVAFVAFIRDITLQKKNELELEKNKKALEHSNHELEQFAHVVSHDLKEPIRKIRMFTERLASALQNTPTEKAQVYLDKIQNSAQRLTDMVEGVLTYSLVTGSGEPFEQIEMDKILEAIKQDLELVIEQKNAVISYGSFPPFEGVSFLIHQLMYNLINNSLKFSKDGERPVIDISAGLRNEQGVPFVEILVNDNGIGFDPDNNEKIFKTFTRLNSKEEYEGTGLGLALCKSIVERHSGRISASSAIGEGASFHIMLPQHQSE